MAINYKIPIGYVLILLGLVVIFPLGTFGYLDDSFSQTAGARWFSIFCIVGPLIYFLITPRNKKIVVSEQGISVPRILFPPYSMKSCKWEDIISHKLSYDKKGSATLILKTKSGNIKIYGLLCFRNFEFAFKSRAFESVYYYIISKRP